MVSTSTQLPNIRSIDEQALSPWLEGLCSNHADPHLIRQAFELLARTESGQEHEHLPSSLAVTDLLASIGMDSETLAAALLHPLVERGSLELDSLRETFSDRITRMIEQTVRVARFTRQTAGTDNRNDTEHVENLRRLLLDVAEDIRTLLIVLARQVVLMRRLKYLPPEERTPAARDTRDIFAPLANRLGIWQIKWELEDFALRYLEPDDYHAIASMLDGRREDRERYIEDVVQILRSQCDEMGINAQIAGRPKHIFSIWKKMRRKKVSIDQIFDLRAVRILVNNLTECYTALGMVHGLWRHIPGEFDDYVATPKPNGYKSIHTAVIGPEEKTLEIQIRTHEMHETSELGVAAHWRYKEQGRQDSDFERRIVQLRNWLAHRDEEGEPQPQSGKIDEEAADNRQVYVFTPAGKVVELSPGATALDFAYAVHTEVGHRCRGAKADGRIIQLNQPLISGQVIEVITAKEGGPSQDWLSPHLNYLHTSRARNRVRQWFRQQDYAEHLQLGRTALEKEIAKLGTSRPDLQKVAERFNLKTPDDLLAAIGRGDIIPLQVANFEEEKARSQRRNEVAARISKQQKRRRRPAGGEPQIVVDGLDDLLIHKARCCQPLPGDDIIGFISRGQGIKVHRADCKTIAALDEESRQRLIDVEWDMPEDTVSVINLHILAHDRRGLLSDLSNLITNEDAYVLSVNTESNRKQGSATMQFSLEVTELAQLSRLIDKIHQLPEVIKVRRES